MGHRCSHVTNTAFLMMSTNVPQLEKTYLLTCLPNEDSNQPAHPLSLTRFFVVAQSDLNLR